MKSISLTSIPQQVAKTMTRKPGLRTTAGMQPFKPYVNTPLPPLTMKISKDWEKESEAWRLTQNEIIQRNARREIYDNKKLEEASKTNFKLDFAALHGPNGHAEKANKLSKGLEANGRKVDRLFSRVFTANEAAKIQ